MAIRPPSDGPADIGDTPFDALDDDLFAAAPQGDDIDPDDGAFDAGLLPKLKRGELDDDTEQRVIAQLAESAARRDLLEYVDQPLPPGLTARMVDAVAPRRRSRAPIVGGVVTVLALAAALLVFAQRPTPPPGFEAPRLSGGVAAVKSSPTHSNLFVPDSVIGITLVPFATVDGTLAVGVFESAPPGAALTPLPDSAVEHKPGGAIVLRTPARTLFGDRFGPRTVYIGVAREAGTLPDAGGAPPGSSQEPIDGVRWYAVPIDYQAVASP